MTNKILEYHIDTDEIDKKGDKKATRAAYGETLAELGVSDSKIVVLDADLSGSTTSKKFKQKFPERFFNMGIAESNMAGVSAGLAAQGYKPFYSTFSVFAAGRAFETIRQSVCYPKQNVKVCGTHGGVTVGEDGGSHQSIEDISIMRTLPNMSVFVPADYSEVKLGVKLLAEHEGPVFMRMGRAKLPVLFGDDYPLEFGKWVEVRPGTDITIIACGVEVYQALKAAEALEKKGFFARVINASWVKPVDFDMLADCIDSTDFIVTCEEHSIIGGLGSAVAEFIAEHGGAKMKRIGVKDKFGTSGDGFELLEKYELTAPHIEKAALELLKQQV